MARVSEPRAGVLLQGTAQPAPGEDPCEVKVPAQEAFSSSHSRPQEQGSSGTCKHTPA